MQADILDRRPDDGQATGLRREHVDLIGALAYIAEETLNGIGALNVAVHALRKRIKGQEVLFVLSQASYRCWIALALFGFEGSQLCQGLLFAGLLPNSNEFGLNLTALSSGDSIQHMALFMQQTALTRGGREQVRNSSKQPIMSIRHNQINLGYSS